MHVLSTWNVPSAVYHSAKLGKAALVIAKSNRIEVVKLADDGLRHICGIDLWGQITSLNVLNNNDESDTAPIFVTTDHPRPMAFVLSYSASTSSITVAHSINLHTRADRLSEYFQGAVVDRTTGLAVSLAYSSSLKVIPTSFDRENSISEFDARIPELSVVSMCFLPPSALAVSTTTSTSSSAASSSSRQPSPILAILHIDSHLRRQLIARSLDLKEKELSSDGSGVLPVPMFVDPGASLLIPVSGTSSNASGDRGGVLVVGGGVCQYIPCSPPTLKTPPSPTRQKKDVKGKSTSLGSPEGGKKKRARENSTTSLSGGSNPGIQINIPFEEVSAYDFIDQSRILLSNTWGRVALLSLQRNGDNGSVTGLKCTLLSGEVSSATTLTYLNDGIFYVGSYCGDNQLVRLLSRPINLSAGKSASHLQILDVYKNVAPISDALISQAEGSVQVIACSGAYNSGSLRIMRRSADFKEQAVIEQINHVTTMWPLKIRHDDSHDRYLMVSTLYSTSLIDLGDGSSGMEELGSDQIPDLSRSVPTIATGNLVGGSSNAIVQVTTDSVRILDLASGFELSSWPPPDRDGTRTKNTAITNAGVNGTQIVVSLTGGRLVYLTLDRDMKLVEAASRIFLDSQKVPQEISALSITPLWPNTHPDSSRIAAVGFWGSNSVSLLSLPSLASLPTADIGLAPSEGHLPRSVLLHTFGNSQSDVASVFILVGLVDGTLVTYELDAKSFRVLARRTMLLGNMPLRLTACKHRGSGAGPSGSSSKDQYQNVVFVSGSRPTIVFLENGRLQHSPISLKDVAAACMFDSPRFQNSLLLSRDNNIVIGQIDTLHELQIRTIMFGLENPVRIAHDPVNQMYGVAVVKNSPPSTSTKDPRDFSVVSSSSLRLLDDVSFEQLDDCALDPADEITSVMSYPLVCNGESKQYWVVGSEILGQKTERGRLSVYALHQGGDVGRVASVTLFGSVSTVAGIDGKIVVAAGAGVAVYELTQSEHEHEPRLNQLSKWERGYQINQIRIQDNFIFTSDALRSVDVLQWINGKLKLFARDHSSLWPITVSLLGEKEVLVAEGQGHIYSYKVKEGAIERAGAYYLGEQITEIQEGSVVGQEAKGDVQPRVVFFTNMGRVGVISSVTQEFGLLLTALERNLNNALPGPGGLEHAHWRAPVTQDAFGESAQVGFVDGDFVERFLEYPNAEGAKAAMEGKNAAQKIDADYSSVVQRLEQLQVVH